MAQMLNRLTAQTVKGAKLPPGKTVLKLGDGGGLWLIITASQKSYVFLYSHQGARRSMGLGAADTVTLATAREHAEAARQTLAAGNDPKEVRDAAKPKANVRTFGAAADAYLEAHHAEWKGGKDGLQYREWRRSLSRQRDDAGKIVKGGYCEAITGKAVADLTVDDVIACVGPEWTAKQVTMSRTRARIEAVLDAAIAAGHRTTANPATWKTLRPLLAKIDYEVEHHPALDWRRLPTFMARLRATPGIAARCLEFIILTAARSQEARLATWAEIDLDGRCWTVPAAHMKRGKEHQVPLSDRAVAILEELEAIRPESGDSLIFPSTADTPLGTGTVADVLHAIVKGATVHGFRSTFSDWANDETSHDADTIENALSHRARGVRGSYRRSTAYTARAELMGEWGAYCTGIALKAAVAPAKQALSVVLAFPGKAVAANAA